MGGNQGGDSPTRFSGLTSKQVISLVSAVQSGMTYKTAMAQLGLNAPDVEHELNDVNLRGFIVYIGEKSYEERKCLPHF